MAVKDSKIKFSISKTKTDATGSSADESTIYFANDYDTTTGKPRNPTGIIVGGQVFGEPHYNVVNSPTIDASNDSDSREVSLSVKKVPNLLKIKTTSTDYKNYDGSSTQTVDKVYAAVTAESAGKATQDGNGNIIASTYAKLASPALTGTPTAPTAAAGTNTTQIATTAFVQAAVDNRVAAADAMVYKGTIGTNGTVAALPSTTAKTGWTYKVVTAGTYAGQACEVGDMIICLTDGSTGTAATWTVVQANLDGAVTGPASSANDNIAVFNGTTGKIIKDGGTIESANPTLFFGGTSTLGNVGSTTFKVTMPANPHKEGKNVVGLSTATSNTTTALTNNNVFLNHVEGGVVKSTHNIKGTGATTVTTDASGNIIINSTNTNTTYTAGTGLTLSGTTFKAKLNSETSLGTIGTTSKLYAVGVDADGKLAVNVPWSDGNTIPAAYCNTAAATATKTATHTSYALTANTYELVTIVTANTANSALTLNINNKGAKPIYINGTASSASNYTLPAGIYIVYYDGTNYQFRTDGKIPGTVVTATKLGTSDVGTDVKPIYLNKGVATEGSQYAGGTAVTLNGTSKAASTASFYAPTSSGSATQALIGSASGTPQWVGLIPASAISAGTETTVASGAAVKSAYDLANTAKTNAATAQSTATSASSTASSALTSANSALTCLTWQ